MAGSRRIRRRRTFRGGRRLPRDPALRGALVARRLPHLLRHVLEPADSRGLRDAREPVELLSGPHLSLGSEEAALLAGLHRQSVTSDHALSVGVAWRSSTLAAPLEVRD